MSRIQNLRSKIREAAWNQSQVTEASHLLVFTAWDNYTEARINAVYDHINQERGAKNEGLKLIGNGCSQPTPREMRKPTTNMPRVKPILRLDLHLRQQRTKKSIVRQWKDLSLKRSTKF